MGKSCAPPAPDPCGTVYEPLRPPFSDPPTMALDPKRLSAPPAGVPASGSGPVFWIMAAAIVAGGIGLMGFGAMVVFWLINIGPLPEFSTGGF